MIQVQSCTETDQARGLCVALDSSCYLLSQMSYWQGIACYPGHDSVLHARGTHKDRYKSCMLP